MELASCILSTRVPNGMTGSQSRSSSEDSRYTNISSSEPLAFLLVDGCLWDIQSDLRFETPYIGDE